MGLTVGEPERFRYTPGQGIACAAGVDEILVGNRAFLEGQHVSLAELPAASEATNMGGGRLQLCGRRER
jgi:cation transport ATPase